MASEIRITRLGGRRTRVGAATLDGLAALLDGELLTADSPGYDEARTIWNGMIDRRPALIVRCRSASDVVAAVRFAATDGFLLSIHGGGHNIAGSAICDGGVTIHLGAMRAIEVDPVARTARVEPGATLADLDRETQRFGLATPLGINSTTGVAGLALGGGFGWLSRACGLTADNLLGADIVTADGNLRHVDAAREPDLFWAIRGGGGNFGVVTRFVFRLHPVGPEVYTGLAVHPLDDAPRLLRAWRDQQAELPDDVSVWPVMRLAPPLPFVPPEWHGRPVLVLAMFHGGTVADGPRALAAPRSLGTPIGERFGPQPYTAWQQTFDPLLVPGARNYWKSHDFVVMPDALFDAVVAQTRAVPTPGCEVFFGQLGGAVNRVPVDATAYPHRSALCAMNVHGRWEDPADDARGMRWARKTHRVTAPYADGVYVNFLTDDEVGRVAAAYGPNLYRLSEIKARVDPTNLFRMNQNVPPLVTA
jgi:FAD/FMN-containing dehydrogenase